MSFSPSSPLTIDGREIPLIGSDMSIGVLYMFAIGSLAVYGLVLAGWARRLALSLRHHEPVDPVLEFYADAGAPEGALYINGRLVGHLPGVTRL